MAEAYLDTDGDVEWFAGYGPKKVTGPCTHTCDHNWTLHAIAWGPDFEHYILDECQECGCRGWSAEYPPPFSPDRPKMRQGRLMAVEQHG